MNCCKCSKEINPLRIKALPEAKTCVNCSTTSRWYVRNVFPERLSMLKQK